MATLALLVRREFCVCSELVLELLLSQSTMPQHFKESEAAGLWRPEAAPRPESPAKAYRRAY